MEREHREKSVGSEDSFQLRTIYLEFYIEQEHTLAAAPNLLFFSIKSINSKCTVGSSHSFFHGSNFLI